MKNSLRLNKQVVKNSLRLNKQNVFLFPASVHSPPNPPYKRLERGVPTPQMRELSRDSFGELDLCLLEFGGTWELQLHFGKSKSERLWLYHLAMSEQRKGGKDRRREMPSQE